MIKIHKQLYLTILVFLFSLFCLQAEDHENKKPVWMVITKPIFKDALMPLLKFRENKVSENS